MATATKERKPRQKPSQNEVEQIPTRSIRVTDEKWDKARLRAEARGGRVSRVAALLVVAYADGLIDLPDVS